MIKLKNKTMLKRFEVINLIRNFGEVKDLQGIKFAYAVARNINILKPEFERYEKDRIALAESCAKKDKDGKAETKDNTYVFEDLKLFQEELQKLNDEAIDIDLFMVDYKDVPTNISVGQMNNIFAIIREEEKPAETPKEKKVKK